MYHLYLLLCKDKSIYTGITTDVKRRFLEHKKGKGAEYTRWKGVKKLLYSEKVGTVSEALKREREVKSWPRAKKLQFVRDKKPRK